MKDGDDSTPCSMRAPVALKTSAVKANCIRERVGCRMLRLSGHSESVESLGRREQNSARKPFVAILFEVGMVLADRKHPDHADCAYLLNNDFIAGMNPRKRLCETYSPIDRVNVILLERIQTTSTGRHRQTPASLQRGCQP